MRVQWHDSDTLIYKDAGTAQIDGFDIAVKIEPDYETSAIWLRGKWGNGPARDGALHNRDSRGKKWYSRGEYAFWHPDSEHTVRFYLKEALENGVPLRQARQEAVERALLEMCIAKGDASPISWYRVIGTAKKAGVTLATECISMFEVANPHEAVAAKWYDADFQFIYDEVENDMLVNLLASAKGKLAELLAAQ